jgi:hypothetical protein
MMMISKMALHVCGVACVFACMAGACDFPAAADIIQLINRSHVSSSKSEQP